MMSYTDLARRAYEAYRDSQQTLGNDWVAHWDDLASFEHMAWIAATRAVAEALAAVQ